jgi:hypothetical protein
MEGYKFLTSAHNMTEPLGISNFNKSFTTEREERQILEILFTIGKSLFCKYIEV